MPTITEGDIKQRYQYNLSRTMLESWVGALSDDFDSDQAVEKYPWIGTSPKMREWNGTRKANRLVDYDFTVRNQKYEATVEIPGEYIRRGRFQHVDRFIRSLAVRNVRHWGLLMSKLIKDAESATAYDGVSFFGTHNVGNAGDQSNDITYDATTPAAPTVAEAADAIGAAIDNLLGRLDDQGEPMHEGCKEFLVMVPHNLRKTFGAAIGNELITNVGATGVETNILQAYEGVMIRLVGSARLSNALDGAAAWTTKFATFCLDAENKPFIRQDEIAMSRMIKFLREGSDFEFENDAWKVGTQASRAVAYGSWESAVLTTFN